MINKENIARLQALIENKQNFNNWEFPSQQAVDKEYNVEYQHHIKFEIGEIWPSIECFTNALNSAKIVNLTEEMDKKVYKRSRTKNIADLVNLISTYRSWPEFRNMSTLEDMIYRFRTNDKMTMPIILTTDNQQFLMSGNTKLDLAFMMNIIPKALIIDINANTTF